MTPFQQAIINANAPTVSTASGDINFFGYQLAVHKYNLGIMSLGMKCRGITFTQIKKYYGLKGRTAADCLPQLQYIMDQFKQITQAA
jgi:hypothetical protein